MTLVRVTVLLVMLLLQLLLQLLLMFPTQQEKRWGGTDIEEKTTKDQSRALSNAVMRAKIGP